MEWSNSHLFLIMLRFIPSIFPRVVGIKIAPNWISWCLVIHALASYWRFRDQRHLKMTALFACLVVWFWCTATKSRAYNHGLSRLRTVSQSGVSIEPDLQLSPVKSLQSLRSTYRPSSIISPDNTKNSDATVSWSYLHDSGFFCPVILWPFSVIPDIRLLS